MFFFNGISELIQLQTHNLLKIKTFNLKPSQTNSKASNQIQVFPCLLSP